MIGAEMLVDLVTEAVGAVGTVMKTMTMVGLVLKTIGKIFHAEPTGEARLLLRR